jgi:hypothetical protein
VSKRNGGRKRRACRNAFGVHRDKYDRRPYGRKSDEDFRAAMERHANYYANKRKG